MNLLTCLVCGGAADCSHFGAVSCRACSAFFRRKVIECREIRRRCDGQCKVDTSRRNVCQKCRFEKCLDVGMRISAVYGRLEKRRAPNPLEHLFRSDMLHLLEQVREVYGKLETTRKITFRVEDDHIPQRYNYKQMNAVLKTDFRIQMSTMGAFFDSMTNVSECQKKLLLNNFLIKFFLLDCGFKSGAGQLLYLPNGNCIDFSDTRHFYSDAEDQKSEDSSAIMQPYWNLMRRNGSAPLAEVQLDLQEFLLLSAVLYWDPSVPELSEESSEVCRQMKTRVLRELIAYEKNNEKGRSHSMRIGDIMMLLNTVQKLVDLIEEVKELLTLHGMYERHEAMFEAMNI